MTLSREQIAARRAWPGMMTPSAAEHNELVDTALALHDAGRKAYDVLDALHEWEKYHDVHMSNCAVETMKSVSCDCGWDEMMLPAFDAGLSLDEALGGGA